MVAKRIAKNERRTFIHGIQNGRKEITNPLKKTPTGSGLDQQNSQAELEQQTTHHDAYVEGSFLRA